MIKILFLMFFLFSNSSRADECLNWFLKSKLVPKKSDCELKCVITPVDMGTFSCTDKCSKLCSKSIAEHILTYVPRLTEGDKLVISKMPYEAYKVFLAKEQVDSLTIKIFKTPSKGDESDAFRHFVWSALLAKELGAKKAEIFLNAHEEDSTQNKKDKEMDLHNNKLGLEFYKNKKKLGHNLEIVDFEREALKRLRLKKLKVINSKFKTIPGGYYSK